MTTYTWKVKELTAYSNYEGQQDVVFKAAWVCQGEETIDDKVLKAEWTSKTSFTVDVSQGFTPYNQLTENQVLLWIWANGVNKTEIESNVQTMLNAEKSPAIVQPPVPWATEN